MPEAATRVLVWANGWGGTGAAVRERLASVTPYRFALRVCTSTAEVDAALRGGSDGDPPCDVALLDLSLHLPPPRDALRRLRDAGPGMPVLLFGPAAFEDLADPLVLAGAKDFLPADRIDGCAPAQTLYGAAAGHRREAELTRERDGLRTRMDHLTRWRSSLMTWPC